MNPTRRRNGRRMVTANVKCHLVREEVLMVACLRLDPELTGKQRLTKLAVEGAVRAEMHAYGASRLLDWESHDPPTLWRWADAELRRLWPDWKD